MAANMVFEAHGGGVDIVFCVVIVWLSVMSMIIFATVDDGRRRVPPPGRVSGPVFVGGKGCPCGGCRAGTGVCGTYLMP